MKGNENADGRLNELKNEIRNITDLMSKVRSIHPSTWMKNVRGHLVTLLNAPGTVSEAVQWECLLAKLRDALDSVDAAMKISSSEKLVYLRERIINTLNKFSGKNY